MLTKLYVRAQGLLTRDEGATAVEYGIMVAAIAVAILLIVFTLGDQIAALFTRVSTQIGTR